MTAKKNRKRTDRLEALLSGLHCINWIEPLPGDQGWEVIHATIGGGRNALILDMKHNGYQVFVQDNGPIVETIEDEISRLCPTTGEECKTCIGHGRIEDGEDGHLRKCEDCNGSGKTYSSRK